MRRSGRVRRSWPSRSPTTMYRLRVRTENTGRAPDARAARGDALRHALLAAHTLLGGEGVEFVSLTDPPAGLREHVRDCRNAFTFPVLGGPPQETGPVGRVVLSSPIILPDRPQVAPESPGDLHDAAEIDEILTLRTMLLTDEEKAEARATDPRAARILDRVDSMPQEVFARLHGAIRSLTPVTPAVPGDPSEQPAWWQEDADEGCLRRPTRCSWTASRSAAAAGCGCGRAAGRRRPGHVPGRPDRAGGGGLPRRGRQRAPGGDRRRRSRGRTARLVRPFPLLPARRGRTSRGRARVGARRPGPLHPGRSPRGPDVRPPGRRRDGSMDTPDLPAHAGHRLPDRPQQRPTT
ncbi:hypothetical protein O1M54_48165 [Streptomyces diastatochromogenes]|nr:hypothetical protein [Streptomyces diastatochromogenes]